MPTRCRPSPCDRLSRPPSTTAAPPRPRLRPASRLSAPSPLAGRKRRNGHGRFPRSLRSGRRVRHPALPLRHHHGVAAASSPWPPGPDMEGHAGEFPPRNEGSGAHRIPARIRRVGAGASSRGVTTPVPRVYLLALLTAPGPFGSAGPARLRQGCSRLRRRPAASAALSFTQPLRRQGDEGLPPPSGNNSASWRTPSRSTPCPLR
jgi:hypothetical protein